MLREWFFSLQQGFDSLRQLATRDFFWVLPVIIYAAVVPKFAFAWSTISHASAAAKEFFDYCRKLFPVPFTFVLTDNGSEFKKHFSDELKRLHLVHYHTYPNLFNQKLMEWLIWYNTERTHTAFKNILAPLQFMISLKQPVECNYGWAYILP